jgi:uncharacterized protein YjiS (DUF1127 family)
MRAACGPLLPAPTKPSLPAPPVDSKAFTWRLTAPWMTNSSSAARVRLSWRAAASNAFKALSGGSRRNIHPRHEENSGRREKRCFARNLCLLLLMCSVAAAQCQRCRNRSTPVSIQPTQRRPVAAGLPGARILSEARSSPLTLTLRMVSTWIRRSAQRRALRDLAREPRLLSDLGLTRSQALREADKLFWRP